MLHRPLVFHPASVMTNQVKLPEHQMPASEGGPSTSLRSVLNGTKLPFAVMNAVRSVTGKQPSKFVPFRTERSDVAPAPPRE